MSSKLQSKQIAETLGVVALIASLVFVGMQLQLDREVSRIAVYHQAIEQMTVALNETNFAEIMIRYPDLDEAEAARVKITIDTVLFSHELIYDMYVNGLVDEDHWNNMFDNNWAVLQTPMYMDVLKKRPGILSKRFLDYANDRLGQ